MTEPTAGDPFRTPPGGATAAPASPPVQPAASAPPTPGYSAPDGYYPQGYPPQKKQKSWMNIVSLSAVAGGLIVPFFGNIVGIVFGHLGRRAAKRGEADYPGVGLAGLILNYFFVVAWIVATVAFVAFMVWAINDCANDPYCNGSVTYGT